MRGSLLDALAELRGDVRDRRGFLVTLNMRAGSRDRLVGRAAELASIERSLEALRDGGSDAVVLVGEPGIGKTRLLRELAARAEQRGYLVLPGSGSELERDLPFSVFVDAL